MAFKMSFAKLTLFVRTEKPTKAFMTTLIKNALNRTSD
ncbi:hypothetical protein FCR2A7T_10160 [Flavobacterium cauense R2A-7]|nr:hypothetical protein FCR2A7T_10160 [Flavobacterium cauense R2A-7]